MTTDALRSDGQSGDIVGWITISEVFLLVCGILLAAALLLEKHLTRILRDREELAQELLTLAPLRETNARLVQEMETLSKKCAALAAEVDELTESRKELEGRLAQALHERDDSRIALVGHIEQIGKLNRTIREKEEAEEKRFAGIDLSGRRVVLIVDMSGSMDQIDPDTRAPGKWDEVCDTLARILRSLPKLEKFQVVVFAENAWLLLGREGEWIDCPHGAGVEEVRRTLRKVQPRGGTNLHAAFEAAFRFRARGLDTIYLFSDGLPNLCDAGLENRLRLQNADEARRNEVLGKDLREKLRTDWNRPASGQRVRIHSVGFFYESPAVGSFLWGLSRENDGSFVGMSRP
jgi:hypothetical protein